MIQFNLLPDVKLEYLKAERTRRLVISASAIATVAAVGLLIIFFGVTTLQKKHLSDLNKDIKANSAKINGQADVNKILTVQNQLKSLGNLHDAKPAASRLSGYLSQITPAQVSINNLQIDFGGQKMTVTGTADTLASVNQYVDTLKFTTFGVTTLITTDASITCLNVDKSTLSSELKSQANENCSNSNGKSINPAPTDSKNAFSDVVLTSFALTQHEADYTISFTYSPDIFNITKEVTLTVPNKVTTRSELEQPSDLFKLPVDNPTGSTR